MRILAFGTGKFFQNREETFFGNFQKNDFFLGFVDNRAAEIKMIRKWPVYLPSALHGVDFDAIVLMSVSHADMRRQLIEEGVSPSKIWTWEEYRHFHARGRIQICTKHFDCGGNRVLILTTDMNYNGGSIAAVYAARALREKGNNVCIVAPSCDNAFLTETVMQGEAIAVCPSLMDMGDEERMFISLFDVVLVNVFQMLPCACEVSKFRPVLWWIHEPRRFYAPVIRQYPHYFTSNPFVNMCIVAVSDVAKRYFQEQFPGVDIGVMPFGIPDERRQSDKFRDMKKKFAVIGHVLPWKGQDVYLEAAGKLLVAKKGKVCFWVIGFIGEDEYAQQIRICAERLEYVRITGNLTRKEMNDMYQEIDVVVCPSREETMSIVIIEGMMREKICITTDGTGIAKYIDDGVNGFICKAGDSNDLCRKMIWVLEHEEECGRIRKNARKTYETFFSMGKFGERLTENLLAIERKWRKHP